MKIGSGFTGGARDLVHGFTGVFTKPVTGAKEGGAKGFFKGLGQGVMGLVTAPITAVLRLSTGLAAGITDAATLFAKGKVTLKGRCRFPRYISDKGIIEVYNSELAQAQELLGESEEHKNESLAFYMHMTEKKDIIVIVTLETLLHIVDGDTKTTLAVQTISSCKLEQAKNKFVLTVVAKSRKVTIEALGSHKLAKLQQAIYQLPTQLPHRERQGTH